MRPKKIYTPVKNENSWQTRSEHLAAVMSKEDKGPWSDDDNSVKLNEDWTIEPKKNANNVGKKVYDICYKNKCIFTAAALGGLGLLALMKSRKRGGGRRQGKRGTTRKRR